MFKTEDFNYYLPKGFIAQSPVSPRDSSKLLVFDTVENEIIHEKFSNIGCFLHNGDVLVVNVSKVIPARIIFMEGGREIEIFVLKDCGGGEYQVMVKPGRIFKTGKVFTISPEVKCAVKDVIDDGTRIVEFIFDRDKTNFETVLGKIGKIPFPPYVSNTLAKPEQYQTVYAKRDGSVAAPTAGLHFTPRLIDELKTKNIHLEEVVLHVNRGTFMPVKSEYIDDHKMHSECFSLDSVTADRLSKAKREGRRIIAVGTTSVRVLESCYDKEFGFVPKVSETDIFIYPGKYKWKVVDGLVTNFHLPKSTLLMLVASFLEHKGVKDPVEKLLSLYELAKTENYRFYSFGDAMFIF
ncbi:MAG: tRNA preQ1(34) S-adenosylmethionine ribosyltransferase-isomerase QueA [Candidatus Gracilibacteria bacterium]|jgi:S-adenosylmethionine:tRNA ribosyltransferase-isomerase